MVLQKRSLWNWGRNLRAQDWVCAYTFLTVMMGGESVPVRGSQVQTVCWKMSIPVFPPWCLQSRCLSDTHRGKCITGWRKPDLHTRASKSMVFWMLNLDLLMLGDSILFFFLSHHFDHFRLSLSFLFYVYCSSKTVQYLQWTNSILQQFPTRTSDVRTITTIDCSMR